MTRIDELRDKYPNIPLDIIAKWDILARGVRDNDDLARAGQWHEPFGSYQSYDHDVTLQDLRAQGKLKDGLILEVPDLAFPSGLGARMLRNTQSTYQLRDMGDGTLALYDGEERVNLEFTLARGWHEDERDREVTSRGTPVRHLVERYPGQVLFRILVTRYCEYFATGDQCKFCNFNGSQDDLRGTGLKRAVTVNLDETVEAYKIVASKDRMKSCWLEAGGFTNGETETGLLCRFIERLASAVPYKPDFSLFGEAMTEKQMQRLRDSGLNAIGLQMELWAPELFEKVIPGKAKRLPREGWLESFEAAVDVFGVGRVDGHFVAGVTLLGPDGFKSVEEAKASHIEGDRWLIKRGICSTFNSLRWSMGSEFAKDPNNRKKLPPADYYLDIALAHHEAMMEHGLYPKQDVLWAGRLGAFPYNGEIGILKGVVSARSWDLISQ